MKKKNIKKIRKNIILAGNFIIAILLLLNIKEVKTLNDYRANILYIFTSSILILLDYIIIDLRSYKKER